MLLGNIVMQWIISVLVAVVFTAAAHAQTPAVTAPTSRLDEIVVRGTLRVGLTGDYKPFSYFDKTTSTFEGFDVDMAQALGQALGAKVAFVQTSWPTMTKDFEANAFDMVAGGVSITLDRQKKGSFSTPIMREGKTPIARCADKGKFETLADIDKPGIRVIVNPGGTNERFARANVKTAPITVYQDNVTIFDEIASGHADLMMTDASETRFQQKMHPGVLCAVHPDAPFDFAEKAYWLQRDVALKDFVDQWLHIITANGSYKKTYDKWFN
jgi:cyclohexadienyl dehydratase